MASPASIKKARDAILQRMADWNSIDVTTVPLLTVATEAGYGSTEGKSFRKVDASELNQNQTGRGLLQNTKMASMLLATSDSTAKTGIAATATPETSKVDVAAAPTNSSLAKENTKYGETMEDFFKYAREQRIQNTHKMWPLTNTWFLLPPVSFIDHYESGPPFALWMMSSQMDGLRADLDWAQAAARQRAAGQPIQQSWSDFENARWANRYFLPTFTWATILLCVVVQVVSMGMNDWKMDTSRSRLRRMGMLPPGGVPERTEWHRWITAHFLHTSVLHCLSSVFLLWQWGGPLERSHGANKIAFIFMASAVCGIVMKVFLDGTDMGSGTSIGLMGLRGAMIADIWMNWDVIEAEKKRNKIFGNYRLHLWWGIEFGLNFLEGRFLSNADGLAHLCGGFYGFCLALQTFKVHSRERTHSIVGNKVTWQKQVRRGFQFLCFHGAVCLFARMAFVLWQHDGSPPVYCPRCQEFADIL